MHILFVSNFFGEYYFQARMADHLKSSGFEPLFLSRSRVPDDARVFPLRDLFSRLDRESIRQNLSRHVQDVEKTYGFSTLEKIYRSDRLLRHYTLERAQIEAVCYFRMWERFFDEHSIDYYFWFFDGDIIFRSAHYVALHRKIPSYARVPAFFMKNAHAWHDNEFDRWDDDQDLPLKSFSPEDRGAVEEYIQALRSRKISFKLLRLPSTNTNLRKLYKLAENLWYKFQEERYNEKWRPLRWCVEFVQKVVREVRTRKLYSPLDPSVPFLFLPLHNIDDAQLTIRAQDLDMVDVVLRTAEAMPEGYLLYIKEHPMWVGVYPLPMIQKMISHPRVRLIPPDLDAQAVIRHCRAVVTINNTVGYEGVILRKPVVTLHPSFYSRMTHRAASLEDLAPTIREALQKGVTYSEDELLRFLLNLRACTFQGKPFFILNPQGQLLTRREIQRYYRDYLQDARHHAESILAKIERVNRRKNKGASGTARPSARSASSA